MSWDTKLWLYRNWVVFQHSPHKIQTFKKLSIFNFQFSILFFQLSILLNFCPSNKSFFREVETFEIFVLCKFYVNSNLKKNYILRTNLHFVHKFLFCAKKKPIQKLLAQFLLKRNNGENKIRHLLTQSNTFSSRLLTR